jgi:isoleucyl-tRNA synthetase
MVPVLNPHFKAQFDSVKNIILSEVNVKEVEYLTDTEGVIKKKIKPNFKVLGPKYSKLMKQIADVVSRFSQKQISEFEKNGQYELAVGDDKITLKPEDVEIVTEDIPGWTLATEGNMTIALDINLTDELKEEGIAREFINKIQNLRKESNFEVTDRILISILSHKDLDKAILIHKDYICAQTLANSLTVLETLTNENAMEVEIDKDVFTKILVERINKKD